MKKIVFTLTILLTILQTLLAQVSKTNIFTVVDELIPSKQIEEKTNREKFIQLGIINGLATYLPKPEYTLDAKAFCASGKVQIEILADENGNVIKAKAISGDELLRGASIEAAKRAKFRRNYDGEPVKIKGILVYNFPSDKKCFNVGIVNKKAKYLPKPVLENIIHRKHLQLSKNTFVKVAILIDETGKVVYARAVSGHPLLYSACENSARQAKFPPTSDVGKIRVKAFIVYKIKPDGKVETGLLKKTTRKNLLGKLLVAGNVISNQFL